jgi:hypothetical protein
VRVLVLTALSLAAASCERAPPSLPPDVGTTPVSAGAPAATEPAAAGPPASAAPPAPPAPPALASTQPLVELAVEGWAAAVVSLPLGATGPRPIVLATHGNYDRPEWQCEVWRGIVGDRAFILCPRGLARPDSPAADDIRFTYANNQALEKEIDAGLAALRARWAGFVAEGPILYTGFSLGAIMGVAIAARGEGPARYPRMILVEGGYDRWTAGNLAGFTRVAADQRILFGCGGPGCMQGAKVSARALEQRKVQTRVVGAVKSGHTYDGAVADEVKAAFGWVIEGDARWK